LDDLHSEAWIRILERDRKVETGTFVAQKMVCLYGDQLRRDRAESNWLAEYERRLSDTRHVHATLAEVVNEAEADVRSVLELKLNGYTHDEIAAALNISKRTVNYRLKSFWGGAEQCRAPLSAFEMYKMFVDLKLHFKEPDFVYVHSTSNASDKAIAVRRDTINLRN
jgi:DNA-directed RNA polymerase specialized sigma24 family protein